MFFQEDGVLRRIILLNTVGKPWAMKVSSLIITKYKCVRVFAADFLVADISKESSGLLVRYTPLVKLALRMHSLRLKSSSFQAFFF